MSVITQIGTASPKYKYPQNQILAFMQAYAQTEKERRALSFLYHKSGIDFRYSVLPDFGNITSENPLFNSDESLSPSVEERLAIYDKAALPLAAQAVHNAISKEQLTEITHLITVSCTGLAAPGIDIGLVQHLGLSTNLVRTSVNFMGCYAAIHGLKLADAFCKADATAKVLVVCVELCTLHFQYEQTADNLLANMLFADGAAALLVQAGGSGLKIDGFFAEILPQAIDDMAWHVSQSGFLMTLKSELPLTIKAEFGNFLKKAQQKLGIEKFEHFAIHPGGKRILDFVAEIVENPLEDSNQILKNYGNMSSCTLVFILKEMFIKINGNTLVAGFGPGITIESMVLSPN